MMQSASTIQSPEAVHNRTRYSAVLPVEASRSGFELLCETFERARKTTPGEYVERFYRLAGSVVQMRIVGRDVAEIYHRAYAPHAISSPAFTPTGQNSTLHTPALTPALTPTLTIDLWDQRVAALPYPLLPSASFDGQPDSENRRDEVLPHEDRPVRFSDEGGRWIWEEFDGLASWLDRKARRMVCWRANGARLPTHEQSKPLGYLLPLWFYDEGIHILHAGVVARQGKGLLITGGSGIGKTTTTLACLLAGFDYLSDDQIAVVMPQAKQATSKDSPLFVAHSVFQSARVLPDHLQRFPELQAKAIHSGDPLDPKTLLYLAEIFPERVAAQAEVRAITLPRLSGQAQTTFRRATRVEALTYMARTSLMTPLGIGRARSELLTQLLGSAPCFWLDLGHDLAHIPVAVDQLLQLID